MRVYEFLHQLGQLQELELLLVRWSENCSWNSLWIQWVRNSRFKVTFFWKKVFNSWFWRYFWCKKVYFRNVFSKFNHFCGNEEKKTFFLWSTAFTSAKLLCNYHSYEFIFMFITSQFIITYRSSPDRFFSVKKYRYPGVNQVQMNWDLNVDCTTWL